jgi:hypothetical protein
MIMKRLIVLLGILAVLSAIAIPVLAVNQPTQQPCTTWGCIKCMWNPRCKGNG